MAKFCNQCGRPLEEGEVCNCTGQATKQDTVKPEKEQTAEQQSDNQKKVEYNGKEIKINLGDMGIQLNQSEDGIPFKKLIGFGESDQTSVDGCFERGLKITPELVAPCEDEQHVKQYELCNARSRLRGLWQEGRLQVTNKRVLFRLSGRSWIGKTMDHTEFNIDEIAGIQISDGVRFGFWDFLFCAVIPFPIAFVLFMRMGMGLGIFGLAAGIASWVPVFMFRKKYFIKFLALAAGTGGFFGAAMYWFTGWPMFFGAITLIATIIALFLFALKPSLSIRVMTKCASESPIYIWSRQNMVSVMEILPGKDAQAAIQELGAMINDIQKFGDLGLRKWQDK